MKMMTSRAYIEIVEGSDLTLLLQPRSGEIVVAHGKRGFASVAVGHRAQKIS
jgi:hypothetical protein